jgi:hypothetical protein
MDAVSARDWEAAFFAVSAILGEPLESSLAAAGEPTTGGATELVRALRGSSRERRARAIARVVSQVAVDVEAMRLA